MIINRLNVIHVERVIESVARYLLLLPYILFHNNTVYLLIFREYTFYSLDKMTKSLMFTSEAHALFSMVKL